jgi:serine/threonine protein kinase
MLSPETILQARYRIIRQLGQGGMGAVYEAIDERLDTVVALKETLFTEERLRKQFEREARLLARLHHQALPRVSDHFNESEGQFLVMQYIPGEDLFEMLSKQKGPFAPEEVLRWADQLCDALDYLHTQDPQIVHRDIKPQNLKLTGRGQAVLLDFGLAKGSAGQMSVVTTSASIFGYTPNYAPLEQVQGLGTDPRSDIYALAATLYHLLTNVKPPDALSRAGAIVNGQSDPLIPANQVNPQVSSAVAAVLGKGMSQKRDDRFASAEVMREALKVAATQQPGDAATIVGADAAALANANTVLLEQGTKVGGAHTTPMASEAHTLLTDDATNVRSVRAGSSETATVVRPPAGANRAKVWLGAALVLIVLAGGAGGFYIYRARKQAQENAAAATTQPPSQSTESNQAEKGTTVDSVQVDPGKTSESKSDKAKVDTTSRAATSKQASEKKAEVRQPEQTQPTVPTVDSHDRERNPDRPNTPPPNPNVDPLRNPQGPGHPPGRDQQPNVRTFPNGGRIVTQPDGTRILIMPNGTTRVMPSGQRPNPRPNQRRRNP